MTGILLLQTPSVASFDDIEHGIKLVFIQGCLSQVCYNQRDRTCPFDCKLSMPNQGDLLVDGRWLFEVGGKNKGFKQIKGIEDSFVVSDGIDIGY